ncbi:MAG TPA: DUF192 domain-containing protein [Verrucomicrobiae bacterium]|nr:DUF192 domain-containing protein [Verrucomicrobiae bacterium]
MASGERKAAWVIGGMVLLLLGFAVWSLFMDWRSSTRVVVGDAVIDAQIARSEQERANGLSKVSSLKANEGMVFVFDKDDLWSVWMKGMRFSIDVIWLDKDKKVVHIVKNISPDTYPGTFKPKNPARYILEVPAGTVDAKNITIGKQASFELPRH